MEFVTSVIGGKAPRDGAALSIALGLQDSDALAQYLHAFHAARQTTPRKNTDLDLGHIQPTAVFGRVVELHPLQNPPGLCWFKGFIQGSGRMGVQVILHDAHILGVRIHRIDQPLDAVSVVNLGTVLGHLHMAPASQRFDKEKQIGCPQPLILVINPLWLSWLQRLWRPHIRLRCHELFVEADGWIVWVVLLFVEVQHIFHRGDKLGSYGWDAPLLVLPRLEFVFLSNWRMVSGEIDEGVAQFDRFSSQQANGPMVVASWNGTTRNGDEMGCLSTRQGEAEALLSLVVEHSLQPSFQVHLSHTDGGVAADVEGVANLLVAPAFGGFE